MLRSFRAQREVWCDFSLKRRFELNGVLKESWMMKSGINTLNLITLQLSSFQNYSQKFEAFESIRGILLVSAFESIPRKSGLLKSFHPKILFRPKSKFEQNLYYSPTSDCSYPYLVNNIENYFSINILKFSWS